MEKVKFYLIGAGRAGMVYVINFEFEITNKEFSFKDSCKKY